MRPSLPKGTRDFTPQQVQKRKYLFDIIRTVFEKYGYQPIETPTMESLSTLTGKYGEEGDKLLFKVLNNGDFLSDADNDALESRDSNKLISSISKRGLRYDLTVPFARYVVMHQNEIAFPFKRYQIQPVWRADKPQKGRYQEFYQCDVDVVGSSSLVYEAEFAQIYDEVFNKLKVDVAIRLNNRKILAGIAEVAGVPEMMTEMTVAIDKLDKIGENGVKEEMLKRGLPESAIDIILSFLTVKEIAVLAEKFATSEVGQKGVEELSFVFDLLSSNSTKNEVVFDITLARGLNYYTGCIFEVVAKNVNMGSLGGGGRYDNLTEIFGLKDVPGIGISFGAERIYDVMEELDLFPGDKRNNIQLLFIAFDQPTLKYAFTCLSVVRNAGIKADIYPDPVKLKKQMKYANDREVGYVALIGEEEMKTGMISLKNMVTGTQEKLDLDTLISNIRTSSLLSEVTC